MWKFPGSMQAGGMSTILEDRWLAEQQAKEKTMAKTPPRKTLRLPKKPPAPPPIPNKAQKEMMLLGRPKGKK